MSDFGGNLKDQNAYRIGDYKVSYKNEDSIEKCTRDHMCNILVKNLSTFCQYPETFCENAVQGDGQINLMEEISNQHNIYQVA